jgi:hypothetical protein
MMADCRVLRKNAFASRVAPAAARRSEVVAATRRLPPHLPVLHVVAGRAQLGSGSPTVDLGRRNASSAWRRCSRAALGRRAPQPCPYRARCGPGRPDSPASAAVASPKCLSASVRRRGAAAAASSASQAVFSVLVVDGANSSPPVRPRCARRTHGQFDQYGVAASDASRSRPPAGDQSLSRASASAGAGGEVSALRAPSR